MTHEAATLPPVSTAPAVDRASADRGKAEDPAADSLFERFAWLYAFFREHLFRDDTEGIAAALWPAGEPPPGSRLLELGCGPGFYSRRLAQRFRQLRVLGIDRSREQLRHAEDAARRQQLSNCRFEHANALDLARVDTGGVDALLSVRLFTVLRERERALAEMHRVLRPGGRCLVAEPCSRLRAAVPLRMLWMLARLQALCGDSRARAWREPLQVAILAPAEFGALMTTQPWRSVWRWQDAHYQYAICEKGDAAEAGSNHHGRPAASEDYAI